jgi:ribonuclease Z
VYGRLKAGETVTLSDGRTVDGRDLTGPTRPGRKVVFSGDTIYTPALVELARDADLLIHEATYAPADLALAERALHSTSDMAARVAREANVKALFLTHISPRYEGGHGEGAATLDDLMEGARAIFPNTFLARDLLVYDVPRRSEPA